MNLLKQRLMERHLTNIDNAENLVDTLTAVVESTVISNEDYLPVYGENGDTIDLENIDNDFETLDENLGKFFL